VEKESSSIMEYGDLIKDLPSKDLLYTSRVILVRGWQEQSNDSLMRDSLICIRELMKRIVQLENPSYDAEELERAVELDGKSLF
jgi:hypothetical protein